MQKERLYYLLNRRFNKVITGEENAELDQLITDRQSGEWLSEWLEENWQQYAPSGEEALGEVQADMYFKKIVAQAATPAQPMAVPLAPRENRFGWLKIAAIFVLMAAGASIYYFNQPAPAVIAVVPPPERHDADPGGPAATLTLSDGTKITLDSAADGLLTRQGNTRILKMQNGQVKYEAGTPGNSVTYNTMSTPKGGEYKLWLPDGTAVWLNAASSITYPTVFSAATRQVSITGEAYFEVTKNPKQPFIVNAGDQSIEVLGTHFNVNAYPDEEAIATTLTEGAVWVKTKNQQVRLQPGQQAVNGLKGRIVLNPHPDLEETLAWKEGVFHFNGSSIKNIMKQASRWYDLEVVYKDEINELFVADIPRNVKISKLLELLELTKHVRFSVQDKTITITKY